MIIVVPGLWEMFQTLSDGPTAAVATDFIQFDAVESTLCPFPHRVPAPTFHRTSLHFGLRRDITSFAPAARPASLVMSIVMSSFETSI